MQLWDLWCFLSKRWQCWQLSLLDQKYPSNQKMVPLVEGVLLLCARRIVWVSRMINVVLKGSQGKSWRTLPPNSDREQSPPQRGTTQDLYKGRRRLLLIFSSTHRLAWPSAFLSPSASVISKHLHFVGYQWTFHEKCKFHLVFPDTS